MKNALETGKVEKTAFRSPLPDLMQVAADQKLTDSKTAYMLNPENTVGVVQVTAIRNSKVPTEDPNAAAIIRLRELAAEVEKAHESQPGDVSISVTGIPALEHDEMHSTSVDMRNAGIVAFFVVGGMLFLAFRGIRHPMLALMTLIVALCWTFGAATLVVKHLNIISVCFPIFLIGLGIDFSVSFINKYLTLRQELYELPDALRETAETTGGGILVSAITTALAFSTAMLTGFPGLAELGLISAMAYCFVQRQRSSSFQRSSHCPMPNMTLKLYRSHSPPQHCEEFWWRGLLFRSALLSYCWHSLAIRRFVTLMALFAAL